jgi:hypothetical protein
MVSPVTMPEDIAAAAADRLTASGHIPQCDSAVRHVAVGPNRMAVQAANLAAHEQRSAMGRKLLDYVERTGDSQVQRRYKDEDGTPLGVWVMRQRKSFAHGALDPDRAHRLQELPGWRWAWEVTEPR